MGWYRTSFMAMLVTSHVVRYIHQSDDFFGEAHGDNLRLKIIRWHWNDFSWNSQSTLEGFCSSWHRHCHLEKSRNKNKELASNGKLLFARSDLNPTNNKARMCSTINLRRVITSHQHLHTAEAKHIGTGTNIKSASFRRYHQSLSKVLLLTARSILAVNSI